jgi:peroxiredoxin
MIKKLLLAFVAMVAMASCGSKNSYKINGHIEGLEDGTMMTLNIIDYNSLMPLDSAVLKNGKFSFKGETDTAQIAVITFDMDDNIGGCELYLERGSIDVFVDVENGVQRVEGAPNNDAFQSFIDDSEPLNIEASEIEDKIRITLASQGDASDFYNQMGQLQERFKAMLANDIIKNAGLYYGYRQLMDNYSLFEPEEVMKMLEALAPTFGSDIVFGQLTAMIKSQLSVSLGHQYLDFETAILDKRGSYDTKAKLSDYVGKNKITLLDFWASWCTPCMNEVPNLKAAYNKFKSKGFEIVSVSVDDDTEAWQNAIKVNGMNWVQLWNGADNADSPAAQYSVTAIPCTFLIDAEGTIIGRNLRGDELEKALEDYFKN